MRVVLGGAVPSNNIVILLIAHMRLLRTRLARSDDTNHHRDALGRSEPQGSFTAERTLVQALRFG